MGPGVGSVKMGGKYDEKNLSAHGGRGFVENSRNGMEDMYDWFETIDQVTISIAMSLELLCSVLE